MLPTELYIKPANIDEEWDNMDDYEKEEALSDFLSDMYGYCHYGFAYEETNGLIYITNIEWDLED